MNNDACCADFVNCGLWRVSVFELALRSDASVSALGCGDTEPGLGLARVENASLVAMDFTTCPNVE